MTMTITLFINIIGLLVVFGSRVMEETDDIDHFKAVMQQIFIGELGEELRRKLESISNEGVILNKTNEEINAMVQARLNNDEKKRMKRAFEAIVGPAKKMASQRVKGQRMTRSSQFNAKTTRNPSPKPTKTGANKVGKINANSVYRNSKIEL